jgi:hypothetical protein
MSPLVSIHVTFYSYGLGRLGYLSPPFSHGWQYMETRHSSLPRTNICFEHINYHSSLLPAFISLHFISVSHSHIH